MTMFVAKLLMGMITMSVLSILYLMEITSFHVPEIKQLNCGKSVQDSIPEPIMGIKSGSEMLSSPMIIKPWLHVLMIKASVSGKWIKRLQSIVFLLMIMLSKLFYSFKDNKVKSL